jgi:hypothetical protein
MLFNVLLTNKPSIKFNDVDISDIVKSLTITESLFDPVLRGHFTALVTGDTNLHQITGSVAGLTKIDFSFHGLVDGSPEKDIKSKDMFVYKMTPGAEESNSTNKIMMCYFASKPMFTNQTRLISKHFNCTISDMVNSLCKELEIQCQTEDTKGKLKRTLCYDNPFSHIVNLSKQAKSSKNEYDVDFVFYQDIDHKYNFKSVSSFKDKEVKWKYKVILPNPEITVQEAKYSILKNSANSFSPLENAMNGYYSSEIISFDSTTGDYYSKTHVYDKNKYTTISNSTIVDLDKEQEFKTMAKSGVTVRRFNKHRFLHDCSEPEQGQDGVGLQDDWVGHRLASMQQLDQVILYLNVPGNSEMRVGDLIEVRKPVNEAIINDSGAQMKEKDIFNTGKFLIAAISHDIAVKSGGPPDAATATYTMRIKAIKDSKGDEYA